MSISIEMNNDNKLKFALRDKIVWLAAPQSEYIFTKLAQEVVPVLNRDFSSDYEYKRRHFRLQFAYAIVHNS